MTTAAPTSIDADEARVTAILALADRHWRTWPWPALQELALECALAGRTVDDYACAALALRCWSYTATRRAIDAAASAAAVSLERISTA